MKKQRVAIKFNKGNTIYSETEKNIMINTECPFLVKFVESFPYYVNKCLVMEYLEVTLNNKIIII